MKNMTLFSLLLVVSSLAQVDAAALVEGRQAYQENCAMCHGDRGRSTMPGAPHFKRGQGIMKPDGMLIEHVRRGKNACPSFLGILDERQIRDVVAFIRTLYP